MPYTWFSTMVISFRMVVALTPNAFAVFSSDLPTSALFSTKVPAFCLSDAFSCSIRIRLRRYIKQGSFCKSGQFKALTGRPVVPGGPPPPSDWWHSCALAFVLREHGPVEVIPQIQSWTGEAFKNWSNVAILPITTLKAYLAAYFLWHKIQKVLLMCIIFGLRVVFRSILTFSESIYGVFMPKSCSPNVVF